MKKIYTVFILFFAFLSAAQSKYFVATSGNNTNNGLATATAFSTIQFAINTAQSGDSIIVAPGIYQENLNFLGKNIKVCSNYILAGDTALISSTIIDGGANGFPVVRFVTGENSSAQLNGFTIRNGLVATALTAAGVYVHGWGSSPTLKNLIIRNNTIINQGEGAGMTVFNTEAITTLVNVQFLNNTSIAGVGGLKVHASNISMTNVEFRNNVGAVSAFARSIGAGSTDNYFYSLRNILIVNNTGNLCVSGSGLVFMNSTIANNNGGIVLAGNSAILNSIIGSGHTITNQGILAIENSLIKDGQSSIINPIAAMLTYQDNISGSIFFNTNNCKIQSYSPAIGHGQDQFQYFTQTYQCPLFDIENSPRDTIGTNSVDIGCYENILNQVVHNNKIYVSNTGTNNETVGLISSPFLSIQAAVDYSFDNDSIILLQGTYSENVICSKALKFKGQGGASNTFWQQSSMQNSILTALHPNFNNSNPIEVSISGITFRKNNSVNFNGTTYGLIAQQAAKIKVENCWFENLTVATKTYYGYFLVNNSVFYNNEIVAHNDAGYTEQDRLPNYNFCTFINCQVLTMAISISPNFTNCLISQTNPQVSSYFQGIQPKFTKVYIDQGITAQTGSIYTVIPNILHFGFVNPALKDFHLKNSSPAIGYGAVVSGITTDFDGTSRPQFAFPDAGAFEHVNNSPANGAPFLIEPTNLTFNEDQPATINLTGIDDGDFLLTQSISISAVSGNQNIVALPSVSYTPGQTVGSISLTPVLNSNGIVPIHLKIQDNGGITNNGVDTTIYTLNVNFTSVNDAPVVVNDSTSTNEDTPVTLNILANDTDVDNAILANSIDLNLTATGTQSTLTNAQGVWTVNTSGVLTYTPASNYFGTASISYKVKDESLALSNLGTITILVNSVNDAPVSVNNAATINEDSPLNINIVSNDSDVDNALDLASIDIDLLTVGIQDTLQSTNGLWTVNGSGILSLVPVLNYNGIVSLNYTVNDIAGLTSNIATVTITINAVNDSPVTVNDMGSTQEDQAVSIDLLMNDYDVDNLLAVNTVDLNTINPGVQSAIITAAGNWVVNTSGILTFTPAVNYNGTAILSYSVKDASGLASNIASITITVNAVNDAPVAVNNSALTNEDTPITINILTNDTDIDNFIDSSSVDFDFVTVGSQGTFTNAEGLWTVNTSGILTFTPAPNFNGNTSISYTVNDFLGLSSNTATITISVIAVNDPPVANDDSLSSQEDVAITLNLLLNDIDVDNQISTNTIDLNQSISGVQNSITLPEGSFTVSAIGNLTFNPSANFNGSVNTSYTVKDASGAISNLAYIYVNISPINDAPFVANDNATTLEDTPISINILSNDSDIENQLDTTSIDLNPLSIGNQSTIQTSSGSWSINSSGTLTLIPALNYTGVASINYTVKDVQGLISNVGVVTVTINQVNDAPDSIEISNSSIFENLVGVIGIFSTIDVDTNQSFNYALVNGVGSTNNAAFTILNNQLQNIQSFNYELLNQLSIRVRSTDQNGEFTEQIFVINVQNVNDVQVAEVIEDTYCNGIAATGTINTIITETNGAVSYSWTGPNSFVANTQNITGLESGNYSLTVIDELDSSVFNFTVDQIPTYNDLSICYVTGDTMPGNHNRIYFNNPNIYNVEYYQILRESIVQDVYDFIGQVSPLDTSFLDIISNNQAQSFSYKVRAIDSCGNFSDESLKHSTILLQSNLSTGNSVNLTWTNYTGSSYTSYYLYRSVNNGPFQLLVTLPASQQSFNDVTANTSLNQYSYFVSIILPSCDFTKSNNVVRSNVRTLNDGGLGVLESISDIGIEVYPNPSNGIFMISQKEKSPYDISSFEIVNSIGQKVLDFTIDEYATNIIVDLSQQANGLYFLKDEEGKWIQQLIVQH